MATVLNHRITAPPAFMSMPCFLAALGVPAQLSILAKSATNCLFFSGSSIQLVLDDIDLYQAQANSWGLKHVDAVYTPLKKLVLGLVGEEVNLEQSSTSLKSFQVFELFYEAVGCAYLGEQWYEKVNASTANELSRWYRSARKRIRPARKWTP